MRALSCVSKSFTLSTENITKLHENNYYHANDKFNTLTGNHIIQTYSENWNTTIYYWLVFVFYGINTDNKFEKFKDALAESVDYIFKHKGKEIISATKNESKDSDSIFTDVNFEDI